MLGPAGGRAACLGAEVWALAAPASVSNTSQVSATSHVGRAGRASQVSDVGHTSLDFMTPPREPQKSCRSVKWNSRGGATLLEMFTAPPPKR